MKKIIPLGFGLLFCAGSAQAIDLGIAAKAGLNGIGLDLSVGLTKNVNLRLIGAAVDIKGEDETVTVGDEIEGDIDAELDFDYGARAAFIDWHAFGGSFRFSAGMYKNTGAADFTGTLLSTVRSNGVTVTPGDISPITGEVSLADSYQPYIGIGWGRGAGGEGGFSFSADIGVALLDTSVDFNATATGGLSQSEIDTALAGMEKDAEDDLKDFEYWPVLAFGINYAF
ncbi:MAG: hypothetical protein PVJ78_12765 [Gammaproteobacteria bacterium]|jgi:hypothetical protein